MENRECFRARPMAGLGSHERRGDAARKDYFKAATIAFAFI